MPKKIAIVEDDTEILAMYKIKLELGGYSVVCTENGNEAVKLIESEKPDLVLLDLLLPEKDGYEILEEIKKSKNPLLAKTPVIVISNLSNENDVIEAKNLGALDFLIKAKTNPSSILDRVNSTFGSKQS